MQRLVLSIFAALHATSAAAIDAMVLADNSQVAASWAQAAPSSATPEVIADGGGTTRIEWKGGVGLDLYDHRVTVPTATGNLTTPYRDGSFHRLQLTGDLRHTGPDNTRSWLQFMASGSNDRAAQTVSTLVSTLQAGHAGEGFLLAAGDVSPSFSTLGTSVGVRGLMGQKLVGQTLVSATAGTLAPLWNDLWDEHARTQPLRHLAAAKLDTALGQATRAFATLQGYDDDVTGLDGSASFLGAARGHTGTIGLTHQQGRFSLQGEVGVSRWKQAGLSSESDHAFILDGGWNGDGYTLQAGHHDLGLYYTSLSGMAQPGIRESYLAGTWQAVSWLGVQGDLRRSASEAAKVAGGATAVRSHAASFSERISFGANLPGLGLTLQQALSDGENPDGSDNRHWGYGAHLAYATQSWSGSVAFSRRALSNDAAPAADGSSDTWSVQVARSLMDDPVRPTWLLNLGVNASWQDQSLDLGGNTETTQFGFTLGASRDSWGSLDAGVSFGRTDPNPAGDRLKNLAWTLEARHPFKRDRGSFALYARDTRTHSGNASLRNTARTLGVQLAVNY